MPENRLFGRSRATLARLEAENAGDDAFEIAETYAFRGQKDRAFDWLDKAYAQKDAGLWAIRGDPRYKALREEWGANFVFRLFLFLQVQAAAAFVLMICVLAAARNTASLGWGDALGLAILAVAVFGEAAADAQLARFAVSRGAKGAVCEIGLWRYSRHPNYFFEWLAWLSYPVIAVGLPADNLYGLIALAGPAMIYWLLVHASGIPPLEAHMLKSRGAAFADYQKRVNAFFPGP